jgi:hypothetical protein
MQRAQGHTCCPSSWCQEQREQQPPAEQWIVLLSACDMTSSMNAACPGPYKQPIILVPGAQGTAASCIANAMVLLSACDMTGSMNAACPGPYMHPIILMPAAKGAAASCRAMDGVCDCMRHDKQHACSVQGHTCIPSSWCQEQREQQPPANIIRSAC